MKISQILKVQQPEEYKKLNNKRNDKRGIENLSFSDYKNMMKNSSYRRVGRRIRQTKY